LRKAQQKKLLGDLAIEEGNFTTAFFKQNAVKELFGEGLEGQGSDLRDLINVREDPEVAYKTPIVISEVMTTEGTSSDDPVDSELQIWEKAIEKAEEEKGEKEDVLAVKISKDEANREFAEFDENVPLGDEETRDEDDPLDRLEDELSPIERYALTFIERIQDPIQLEQLKQADVSVLLLSVINSRDF
jgi:E1A-binding protein p400